VQIILRGIIELSSEAFSAPILCSTPAIHAINAMKDNIYTEKVLDVHHWNEALFTFRTTRNPGLRFRNGEFVMIGLPLDNGKRVMRAYSIASPNYEDHLEFYSIIVQDGALTSRLQHLQVGDEIFVSKKPTGTLVLDDLKPGKNLYLLSTGTGLAPFISLIQDPEIYERFEKVILCHGVRHIADLSYQDFIKDELPNNEYIGEAVAEKLIYYPAVTREAFRHQGRLTHLIETQQLFTDIGLAPFDPEVDRAMICGSMQMNKDTTVLLDKHGLESSPRRGVQGDYVVERAFIG
jgi:ferredoxin--NADP+ reductase